MNCNRKDRFLFLRMAAVLTVLSVNKPLKAELLPVCNVVNLYRGQRIR